MSQNYNDFFKIARTAKKEGGKPAPSPKKNDVKKSAATEDMLAQVFPVKKKKKPAMPIMPIIILIVGAFILGWAVTNMERLEYALSVVEVQVFGPALAQDKVRDEEKNTSQAKANPEKDSSTKITKKTEDINLQKSWTPEQITLFNKLEERKKALDEREAGLAKLEEELQRQKVDLSKRLEELETVRRGIATKLDEKVKIDQEKVEKLVEVFSNMKPQSAAKLFEELNEDLAVEVLAKMKKKEAADILNLIKTDKAQRLSERFAGYRQQ